MLVLFNIVQSHDLPFLESLQPAALATKDGSLGLLMNFIRLAFFMLDDY
jgi:hypothetical protein